MIKREEVPFNLAVGLGLVKGLSVLDKFGTIRDVQTGETPVEVWEFGIPYTWLADDTDEDIYISSSSAADTGLEIEVKGCAKGGAAQNISGTTDGQTPVKIDGRFWRVNRAENNSASTDPMTETGKLQGILYIHSDPNPTNGVPAADSVRAVIAPGSNQTLMALFTIPKGKVGFLYRGELGTALEGNAGSLSENARIQYQSRRYGKIFKVKKEVGLMIGGQSIYQDPRSFPDSIPELTDVRILTTNITKAMDLTSTFDILLVDEDQVSNSRLKELGMYPKI